MKKLSLGLTLLGTVCLASPLLAQNANDIHQQEQYINRDNNAISQDKNDVQQDDKLVHGDYKRMRDAQAREAAAWKKGDKEAAIKADKEAKKEEKLINAHEADIHKKEAQERQERKYRKEHEEQIAKDKPEPHKGGEKHKEKHEEKHDEKDGKDKRDLPNKEHQ